MINKLKQLLNRCRNDKISAASIAIVCSVIALIIAHTILDNFPTICSHISTTFNTITKFLFHIAELPIWLIILAIIIIFFSRDLFSHLRHKRFLKHKECEIDSIIWRWNYILSPKNKYVINNLKPHCALCGCELSLDPHEYYYCANQECDNKEGTRIHKKNNEDIIKFIKKRIQEKFPHKTDKIE